MARVIKPPTPIEMDAHSPSVFLAGSIDMGQAENWQLQFEQAFVDVDVCLLNPRREQWDSTWVQSINNPFFREQVEWELTGLEQASIVAIYFAPTSQAPITLLELGLTAHLGKVVVGCPEGYWRKGNVEITATSKQPAKILHAISMFDRDEVSAG